jgi:cation diffusion facilitator CzcD-associated flavoprotein CzcO
MIVATGIWVPNIPNIPGIDYAEGYESISLNPEDYEGKNVLILGKKNTIL